jgi:uncharacterized protein YxjI
MIMSSGKNMEDHNLSPSTQILADELMKHNQIKLQQIREVAEWFGFETRNKYQLTNKDGLQIAFAAEQQKGFLGFIMRQLLGHWRTFEIHLYNMNRQHALTLNHPFRWLFQRLEVFDESGSMLGSLQQRFSFFYKSFDVEDSRGRRIYKVRSPLWRLWTFTFSQHGRDVAEVQKKWSGLFSEILSDRDNFLLSFYDQDVRTRDKLLILSAAMFIDLQYFEKKASN